MKPSVKSIIEATAVQFKVSPQHILEPDGPRGSRTRPIARPRQVAMYLSREMATTPGWRRRKERQPVSYPQLARIFGRDHTTIIHAHRTVTKLVANDSELAEKIKKIREKVVELQPVDNPPILSCDAASGKA